MGLVVQLIFFSLLPLSTGAAEQMALAHSVQGLAMSAGFDSGSKDLLVDVDFRGNDVLRICSPDELHCQRACNQHKSCQFFSFVRPDWTMDNRQYYCYLKNTNSGAVPMLGVTSGYSLKNCKKTGESDDLVFVNVNKSWREALQYCGQSGSRLVHILNDATQTRVTHLLSSLPAEISPKLTWVGLERCMINPSAPWEWVETGVVEYEHWHVTHPRDSCSYHCGQVVQEPTGDYRWWDACCMEQRPFICQNKTQEWNSMMSHKTTIGS